MTVRHICLYYVCLLNEERSIQSSGAIILTNSRTDQSVQIKEYPFPLKPHLHAFVTNLLLFKKNVCLFFPL